MNTKKSQYLLPCTALAFTLAITQFSQGATGTFNTTSGTAPLHPKVPADPSRPVPQPYVRQHNPHSNRQLQQSQKARDPNRVDSVIPNANVPATTNP